MGTFPLSTASKDRFASQPADALKESTAQDLIARCIDGDLEAFAQLVVQYQDRLFNVCLRIVGNRQDAEDMTQEVLVKAMRAIAGFDGRASFYTWLYRIAVNHCLSWCRRAKGRLVSLDAMGQDGLTQRPAPNSRDSPGSAMEERESHEKVLAVLDRLDAEHRAVVVLRDIESLDYDEIARILDVPRGTVKSRLHRARAALRDALRPMFDGMCP